MLVFFPSHGHRFESAERSVEGSPYSHGTRKGIFYPVWSYQRSLPSVPAEGQRWKQPAMISQGESTITSAGAWDFVSTASGCTWRWPWAQQPSPSAVGDCALQTHVSATLGETKQEPAAAHRHLLSERLNRLSSVSFSVVMLIRFVVSLQRDELGENGDFTAHGGAEKVPCKPVRLTPPVSKYLKTQVILDDILHFNVLVKIWFMV